jgi:hypothetical protein
MVFMDDQGPMSAAVESALTDAPTLGRDAGAVALARRYAALIDEATPASKYREPLLLISQALPDDDHVELAFRKIADALGAHSVASDLGPKLLATLGALGMTVAGRAPKVGGGSGPQVDDELAKLRDRAAKRRNPRAD